MWKNFLKGLTGSWAIFWSPLLSVKNALVKATSKKYFIAGTARTMPMAGASMDFWRIRWAARWVPAADVALIVEAELKEQGFNEVVFTAFNRV